jgi:hypothetical protein
MRDEFPAGGVLFSPSNGVYPMTSRKNSPHISESNQPTLFRGCETVPKSVKPNYKGGRELRCAMRFELWRSTERLSLLRIAARLHERVLKFGTTEENLLKALYRFEDGKHQPPTWLVLLLMQTYNIEFPWEDFLD